MTRLEFDQLIEKAWGQYIPLPPGETSQSLWETGKKWFPHHTTQAGSRLWLRFNGKYGRYWICLVQINDSIKAEPLSDKMARRRDFPGM